MRNYLLLVLIGLITFGVGTKVAVTADRLFSAEIDYPSFPEIETEVTVRPRFSPGDWGCGRGFIQFYEKDDGQEVAEGDIYGDSPEDARRLFWEQIREAKQTFEARQSFEGPDKTHHRYVLLSETESGKDVITILRYDGRDSYRFIEAHTLDLALEFERHLITEVYK